MATDESIIYVTGLTPGNSNIENGKREGTLVAIMDLELWRSDADRERYMIALGSSDANGDFYTKIPKVEPGRTLRVHIREFGFLPIGFDAVMDTTGFYFAAHLDPDLCIPTDVARKKYPQTVRGEWNADEQHLKAQQRLWAHRAQQGLPQVPSASPENAPTVFISYALDPADTNHQKWVERLADDLVRNGVMVIADFYEIHAGKSITLFMESMKDQDKIVMVMTPEYKARAAARTGGVGYEYRIITNEILSSTPNNRIIPVLRHGTKETSVPEPIGDLKYVDMTDDNTFGERLDDIVKGVFEIAQRQRPPLGTNPTG